MPKSACSVGKQNVEGGEKRAGLAKKRRLWRKCEKRWRKKNMSCERPADMVSDSAGMIAWKKSKPKWKDITSDIVMPYCHVVDFGNRLPSTKCKAIAKMPQHTRCFPFNDGRYCGGQMPEDFLSLVPMDPMEDITKSKRGIPTRTKGHSAILSAG